MLTLKITAINAFGKKASKKVRPIELGPPSLTVEKLGNDLHRLVVAPVALEDVFAEVLSEVLAVHDKWPR